MTKNTIEQIKKLIVQTKALRDLYQQQLDDFLQTSPDDLDDEEKDTQWVARAQHTPIDINQIYENIKSSYKDSIDKFDESISIFEEALREAGELPL